MPAKKKAPARKKKAARKKVRARTTPASPGFGIYAKVGVVLLVIFLAAMWVGRMQDVAYKERLDRELSENPALGDWYVEQCNLVKNNEGPAAVWHGRIAKLVVEKSPVAGGAQPLRAVQISEATLLAGSEGRDDQKNDVYINVTDYPLTYGMPVAGQRWVFSVSHTRDGRNKVYSALPSGR